MTALIEENWILHIDLPSEDQMDNQGIAKKMVDYLEDHYLPAPKDKVRVKVNYRLGGNDEVPIDALEMAVSSRTESPRR